MKKFIIVVLVLLTLLVVGCSSTKSIYDNNKSLTTPDSNTNYNDAAKNFYPDYVPKDYTTKGLNASYDSVFKANNITDYKYYATNNTLKVWINNWDNVTANVKSKIKNELMNIDTNIKNIEFVNTKNEVK